MSLFVASLNSGSNGNCYYVGTLDHGVLIDGGISCRETEKRLKRLGISMKSIHGIFVSHEHGDHIHGVPNISKKHRIPVYITPKTLENSRITLSEELIVHYKTYHALSVGDMIITAFPKQHDASDPHSFIVESKSVTVGVFTDIGVACDHVTTNFRKCNAVFLESNYDEWMLENGSYPWPLKNRIRSGFGHLSNVQAANLFSSYASPGLSHLFLSHLSRENNRPKIVSGLFKQICGNTEIIIAPRNKETRLYHIRQLHRQRPSFANVAVQQLSMF